MGEEALKIKRSHRVEFANSLYQNGEKRGSKL